MYKTMRKLIFILTLITLTCYVDSFIGVALPYNYLDGYYKENIAYLQESRYRIFMFGINNASDVLGAIEIGADVVYVDNIGILL